MDIKPAFATGGARLAVSLVDDGHSPTLMGAPCCVGDVYVTGMANDLNVIKR
jgi:hypothetical protein